MENELVSWMGPVVVREFRNCGFDGGLHLAVFEQCVAKSMFFCFFLWLAKAESPKQVWFIIYCKLFPVEKDLLNTKSRARCESMDVLTPPPKKKKNYKKVVAPIAPCNRIVLISRSSTTSMEPQEWKTSE